jgi:hypothetical protein
LEIIIQKNLKAITFSMLEKNPSSRITSEEVLERSM